MSTVARFAEFFATVNAGAKPYPWQCDLVEHVAATGRWPDIAAPTGSGKSAVIDIHVFLVAEHAAGRLDARPPRRLVLVAPRRVLVDDQFERASQLARVLHEAAGRSNGPPPADAARVLRRLFTSVPVEGENPPLAVWRLRGGVSLDNGWRYEPAACQIICATPQMWGSRLLLRGYRASRASRNLEAGMLCQDAVVVIDEAHLHERLVDTARNVASRSPVGMGLQVVAMSATRPPAAGQHGLTAADLEDVGLAGRVRAPKSVEVVEVTDWRKEAAKTVSDRARQAAGDGTVGVFVNDVSMALRVAADLGEGGERTVELVCGRLRLADVARLRARRPGLLTSTGNDDVDFLVSTQSLEVGVDLDLPAMVTTMAPAAALAQRAGRLNRSGSYPASTFAVVSLAGLSSADPAKLKGLFQPYEPPELVAAARWLDDLGESISPDAVTASSLPLPERPTLPALREVDLETLGMTSDVQAAEPDPALYLEDPEDAAVAEVGIVARRHLELEREVVHAALLACPPRPHEVATMRLGKALTRVVDAVLRGEVAPWALRTHNGELEAVVVEDAGDLRTEDTLVVPHDAPICTSGVVGVPERAGLAEPLDDVLEEVPDDGPSDRVVPLPSTAVAVVVAQDAVLGSRAARTALAAVLDDVDHPDLARLLRRHRRLTDLELRWCSGEGTTGLLVVRDLRRRAEQTPSAAADEAVTVDDHQAAVEQRLGTLLKVLEPQDLGADEGQLALAARIHDEGKRHPRFQRRMGAIDVELAKPLPGHVPDRGDGWRHEQLSAAYAARASADDPLVVSLVASHHGRGRPMFDRGDDDLVDGWAECPDEVREWAARLFGPLGSYELRRARLQRRLGVHRLALLEALLRCADMQVSREGG